tara:strand:+ start:334 stop:765 length:432 start_codon:yes stop_codon:yes gene_type:complete
MVMYMDDNRDNNLDGMEALRFLKFSNNTEYLLDKDENDDLNLLSWQTAWKRFMDENLEGSHHQDYYLIHRDNLELLFKDFYRLAMDLISDEINNKDIHLVSENLTVSQLKSLCQKHGFHKLENILKLLNSIQLALDGDLYAEK